MEGLQVNRKTKPYENRAQKGITKIRIKPWSFWGPHFRLIRSGCGVLLTQEFIPVWMRIGSCCFCLEFNPNTVKFTSYKIIQWLELLRTTWCEVRWKLWSVVLQSTFDSFDSASVHSYQEKTTALTTITIFSNLTQPTSTYCHSLVRSGKVAVDDPNQTWEHKFLMMDVRFQTGITHSIYYGTLYSSRKRTHPIIHRK